MGGRNFNMHPRNLDVDTDRIDWAGRTALARNRDMPAGYGSKEAVAFAMGIAAPRAKVATESARAEIAAKKR